jgi:hypothetical protein
LRAILISLSLRINPEKSRRDRKRAKVRADLMPSGEAAASPGLISGLVLRLDGLKMEHLLEKSTYYRSFTP